MPSNRAGTGRGTRATAQPLSPVLQDAFYKRLGEVITEQPVAADDFEPPDMPDEAFYAESDAFKQIANQLRRYARGLVRGCSLLLAGHRGAGKTSTALAAIQQVRWEVIENRRRYEALPMYVPVHGPDLFTAEFRRDQRAANALHRLLCALHWALTDEIYDLYRSLALSEGHAESAGQFRLGMDRHPAVDQLRGHWDRLNALRRGLHRWRLSDEVRGPAQGIREIVALASSVAIMLDRPTAEERQDGAAEGDRGKLGEGDAHEKGRLSFWAQVLHIFRGIRMRPVQAVTGAIVGLALIVVLILMNKSTVDSAIAGGVVGFAITLVWAYLSSKAALGSLTDDHSPAAYDSAFPAMVARCFDAGFAPVFVVDELDKVPDLAKQLEVFGRRIKPFTGERSFFIFLVDREYYDYLNNKLREKSYPLEHTYFVHRTAVWHRPDQLDKYLRELHPQKGEELKDDWLVLRKSLLFRSQLHAGDLRRHLAAEMDEKEQFSSLEGSLKDPAKVFRAWMQAAVDAYFKLDYIESILKHQPELALVVLDAAYYLGRHWESGPGAEIGETDFKRYLLERQVWSDADPSSTGNNVGLLANHERDRMWEGVQEQLGWLSDWSKLSGTAGVNEDLAKLLEHTAPPLKKSADHYHWQYDETGRVLGATPQAEQVKAQRHAEVLQQAEWLGDLSLVVRLIAETGSKEVWSRLMAVVEMKEPDAQEILDSVDAVLEQSERGRNKDTARVVAGAYRAIVEKASLVSPLLLLAAFSESDPVNRFMELSNEATQLSAENRNAFLQKELREANPALSLVDRREILSPGTGGEWLRPLLRAVLTRKLAVKK